MQPHSNTSGQVPEKLLKPYDPAAEEVSIYKKWEDSGYFTPENMIKDGLTKPDAEAFTIVLPPPNVTGTLHVGHAYEDTLQDIIVRFNRMNGKKTLWIPGTDSAAIATQARVEKNLQKEGGKTRHDLGREEMVKRVHAFAKDSENTILGQVRKMGASLDWTRYAYTLDEKRNRAVFTAFKRMYDAGLIYQGHRIVNWDPKGQTTISDDEVVYVEEKAKFYYFQYGPFVIGTARPETKFGDKYIVVNPDDAKYQEYTHGQKIELEWINGPIVATVIKDAASDPEIGTGAMTITPWHSMVDFEIAERHHLDKEQVIDKYGKLLPIAGEFAGLKISEAREKIVEKLKEKGLLVRIEENYMHNIATSERTGATIEPQIMEQWFIGVNKPFIIPHSKIPGIASGSETTLKTLMKTAVESGAIDMSQEGFRKTYFHWIENLHDWCISRQIWFGHRIPVWYRATEKGKEIYCNVVAPEGDGWEQEVDVLDTWFSSALWTFSTLGWPEETPDLKTYHPTSLIAPAYEILPLWVSRMILMSGFHLGQVPFKKVLIHGLVRAKDGRKFSKSLNNGVDPLEMIEKYGADALRMGLIVGSAVGSDIKFDESRIKGYKLFANKLWNIARFVLTNYSAEVSTAIYTKDDEVVLAAWHTTLQSITTDLETYRLHLATEGIYHFIWDEFANTILEESKSLLTSEDPAIKLSRQKLLLTLLSETITALHPFMPFVTEAIYDLLPIDNKQLLMVTTWPMK
ncbi:MAG: valine--tRNA ligase [Candidatus Paceibacterota bacterium]